MAHDGSAWVSEGNQMIDAINTLNVGRVKALFKTPYIVVDDDSGEYSQKYTWLCSALVKAMAGGLDRPPATLEIARLFLEVGANAHACATLTFAAAQNHQGRYLPLMQLLIDHGVDVDQEDPTYHTKPLHTLATSASLSKSLNHFV